MNKSIVRCDLTILIYPSVRGKTNNLRRGLLKLSDSQPAAQAVQSALDLAPSLLVRVPRVSLVSVEPKPELFARFSPSGSLPQSPRVELRSCSTANTLEDRRDVGTTPAPAGGLTDCWRFSRYRSPARHL